MRKLVFSGTYVHTIDAKGRIFIPAAFREGLAGLSDIFVIFKLIDLNCLSAMSMQDYENFSVNAKKEGVLPEGFEDLADEILYPDVVNVEMDSQKRALIPIELRVFARLEKDVAVVGKRNHIEFWDLGAWHARQKEIAEKMKGVSVSKLLARYR